MKHSPLVSIGIPTYNRDSLLKRSIESALGQDYLNIELIVSDNASTDQTEKYCRYFCEKDPRFIYVRQTINQGASRNFSEVLTRASGQYFMWLGDDDWVDDDYVSGCIEQLACNGTISLVSGISQYYRKGEKLSTGKIFNLLYTSWWQRVIGYYAQVADNGMFYGVMRTEQIREVGLSNVMGGDWIMIARLVSMGKAKMIPQISVHRELGGATASYKQIAKSLGLSRIQAILPMATIATCAWVDIMAKEGIYKDKPEIFRLMVAGMVFIVIFLNQAIKYWRAAIRRSKAGIRKLVIWDI